VRVEDVGLQAAKLGEDFNFEGRRFLAKVVEFLDGDSIRVKFRQDDHLVQYRARMAGYDSPRHRPSSARARSAADREAAQTERSAGIAARKALAEKIGTGLVWIECGPFDSHGRLLVTVYARTEDATENGENINLWMISNGHGTPHREK
jgi:endonuclease YncB( thermonuclease family)